MENEIVLNEKNPISVDESSFDETELVTGKKKEKVTNEAKKKNGKTTIKTLTFKNVAIIYKDEIGKICRERIDIEIPMVEKDWYQPAVRKMLSCWFDEQNILPTHIMQVQLPSSGGIEGEMVADFLEKPIGDFDKKDCVRAAIYHRCRTVVSALSADAEEMQRSLFLHLHNLDRLDSEHFVDGVSQWRTEPFDPKYVVPMIK